jgi:sulfur carrier protein ThiS
MRVIIQKSGKTLDMEHSGDVKALLDRLEINPQEVLVVKDGTLITEDVDLSDAKEILIVSVVSGG